MCIRDSLYCVFTIPATTVNVGSCITQSWIAWGLAYTKVESKEYLKLSIPFAYLTSICLYILTALTVTGPVSYTHLLLCDLDVQQT